MADPFDDLDFANTRPAERSAMLAGRFRIVRELGRGGMGTVYLAHDTQLDDRSVAIKMPPAVLARNPRAVADLKREALVAMQLTHPNIVTLRAFEQCDEGVFLVMDFVEGKTLEMHLAERGTLSSDEVAAIFTPIAESLDYAHSKRVVHRDIKPSNIMLAADGTPFIMDFGIAREIKDTYTRVTGRADTSGTLPYMSPEQVRGEAPTPAQDVYSLAAAMFECLTGKPPFFRGQIEFQIINQPVIFEQRDQIPGAEALLQGLAKRGAERPASCGELLRAFNGPYVAPSPPRQEASKQAEAVAAPPSPSRSRAEPKQPTGAELTELLGRLRRHKSDPDPQRGDRRDAAWSRVGSRDRITDAMIAEYLTDVCRTAVRETESIIEGFWSYVTNWDLYDERFNCLVIPKFGTFWIALDADEEGRAKSPEQYTLWFRSKPAKALADQQRAASRGGRSIFSFFKKAAAATRHHSDLWVSKLHADTLDTHLSVKRRIACAIALEHKIDLYIVNDVLWEMFDLLVRIFAECSRTVGWTDRCDMSPHVDSRYYLTNINESFRRRIFEE